MVILKNIKFNYVIAGSMSILICILMVIFPEISLYSAQKGVRLWVNSVLPALLPFFVCANFMIALGVPAIVGRYFENIFNKVFKAPGIGAFIFIISISSGYPMGASIIGDMVRNKELSLSEGKKLLTFCTTSGPLFMLGAVGIGMLGNSSAGVIIAIAHYLGAITNGLFFRELSIKEPRSIKRSSYDYAMRSSIRIGDKGLMEMFTDSIISALKSLGIICVYIVLFTMITDYLDGACLHYVRSDLLRSGIKGLLEITVGCDSVASASHVSMSLKCIACSILISFGGISIAAQSISFLSGSNISPWFYLKVKVLHGALAGLFAALLCPFMLNDELSASTSVGFNADGIQEAFSFTYQLLFSSKMLIMVILVFIITMFINSLFKGEQDENSRDRG